MSKTVEKKTEDKVWFTPHQRTRMEEMFVLIDKAFKIMVTNLGSEHYDKVTKTEAVDIENQIDAQRNLMREENTKMVASSPEDYNIRSAMVYNTLFSSLEKVGDHIINVNEAIVGEI